MTRRELRFAPGRCSRLRLACLALMAFGCSEDSSSQQSTQVETSATASTGTTATGEAQAVDSMAGTTTGETDQAGETSDPSGAESSGTAVGEGTSTTPSETTQTTDEGASEAADTQSAMGAGGSGGGPASDTASTEEASAGGTGGTTDGAPQDSGESAAGGSGGVDSGGEDADGAGGAADGMDMDELDGAGGMASDDPPEATQSAGCGETPELMPGQWVDQPDVSIAGTARQWAIRLPNDYDSTRAYPLVVLLHGCTSGTNNVPIERNHGAEAVLVRGTGLQSNTCWDAGPNGPNMEFFDAMVDGALDAGCVDESRIFAAGYSSGSWLISTLACLRGDRLRAVGTVAGGNALFGNATCSGTVAQIFIHDQDDTENAWSGHESAMNRLIDVNGCSPDDPVAEDPAPCVRYQGCEENPVKFCPTTGRGHDRQDDFAPDAMWDFFSEF